MNFEEVEVHFINGSWHKLNKILSQPIHIRPWNFHRLQFNEYEMRPFVYYYETNYFFRALQVDTYFSNLPKYVVHLKKDE